jgi:hypothetical protein
MKKLVPFIFVLAMSFGVPAATNNSASTGRGATVDDPVEVAPVWAGHPVGFALLTHAPHQFVAFYDDQRRLTLAQRKLSERKWVFTRLPDTTGWDSHNYLTLTADDDGHLHLSGDMHAVPLNYFRTTRPWDAATFQRIASMTGTNESRCTYPQFFRGASNELIFTYRDGGSGNGNQIYNRYDLKTKTWRRLIDQPLTDGEGQRNAYFDGPVKGPDGWYHLAWVWRETPDAVSNHDLSYARSRNLIHWENSRGEPLKLPITLATSDIVDPVPEKGGLINVNKEIGFDHQNRVTISYHKNDAAGHTQPWTARLENGKWRHYQITDWPYRWDFGGGGSLVVEINLGPVRRESDGRLTQTYQHVKFGSGIWLLDPATLQATGKLPPPKSTLAASRVEGGFPGLQVRWAGDAGTSGTPGLTYRLRWETLEANRDRPREGELPPPSMLRLIAITAADVDRK